MPTSTLTSKGQVTIPKPIRTDSISKLVIAFSSAWIKGAA